MKANRFILSIALAAAALACHAETSFNLGKTPWRFTKVTHGEENFARLAAVTVDGHITTRMTDGNNDTGVAAFGRHILVDLKEPKGLCKLTVKFAGDSVASVAARLEGIAADGSRRLFGQDVRGYDTKPLYVNDISEVNGTVGYTRRQVGTAFEMTFDDCRALEAERIRLLGADGLPVDGQITEITVTSAEPKPSDGVMAAYTLDDSDWELVGIPHCYNEFDSYLNTSKGELCWRGETWYRKKIHIPADYAGKRVTMLFHGVNFAMTLYVNGQPVVGNTAVPQPGPVTHVGSSLPFEVDITDLLTFGGDNQIAIKTSNRKDTFFTYPGFAENEGFGQAMGGIVADVYLNLRDAVHIPSNCYSPHNKWGTYYATVSADSLEARLRLQTNVENASRRKTRATLTTEVRDREGRTVWSRSEKAQIAPGETRLFDFDAVIADPHLWYPVGTSGEPYLYTVESRVKVGNRTVDTHTERIGIRTITWDDDYCYVNGERCILRGFGNRNTYPALGAALPRWLQRQTVSDIAACGGNTLRIGHQSPYMATYDACDELGVLLIVNSGDNEWSLKNEPALTYKREYDRDLIVAYRNRPCVAVWESNNGLAYDGERYWPSYTQEQVDLWDYLQPRLVLNRDGYPDYWDADRQIVIGYTNRYEKQNGHPSLNTEVYGTNWSGRPSWCIARSDYDNEKPFTAFYVGNYLDDLRNKACGWIDWMLAESYGEGYTIYLNGRRDQKSLGSCAMDANRIPKLKYRVYRDALWVPFEKRPGVALQSIWNFDEGSIQTVDAWSNCPQVELTVDGVSQGRRTPDPQTRRVTWEGIEWHPGTIEAIGLDADGNPVARESVTSAGEPYALQLELLQPSCVRPGETFSPEADGSDAFIVTARVVDSEGRWCPRADNLLTFSVDGEAVYKGSYNFYVTPDRDYFYHSPGDRELQAEGGLMRVACRTTFTPGDITVSVTSPGLRSASVKVASH